MKYTFATLLSSSDYIWGVIVLYKSLQKYGKTKYPFLCVCSKSVSENEITFLNKFKIKCLRLTQSATDGIDLYGQMSAYRRWDNTFDKLMIWGLTEYEKIVFLDSDMIVLNNIDDLFQKPSFSAVALGKLLFNWEYANAGLIVMEPSNDICNKMIKLIPITVEDRIEKNHFVGDEDVLYDYMPDWKSRQDLHLHEGYNMFFRKMTDYHKRFGFTYQEDIKIVHFIGLHDKPWNHNLRRIVYKTIGCIFRNRYGLRTYLTYQLLLAKAILQSCSFRYFVIRYL